jgi:intracellular sulfur oxidation DsrE/DsrF family protein
MRNSMMAAFVATTLAVPAFAEGETHFVAIHVDQNDPQVMNMALNNAQNVANYYESQGDEVTIELVAYGPGMQMFVAETSPVSDRIASMSLALENLRFSACGNTHRAMIERAGTDVPLLDEVEMTPSGVVRLIELQEDGYAYVRP